MNAQRKLIIDLVSDAVFKYFFLYIYIYINIGTGKIIKTFLLLLLAHPCNVYKNNYIIH